METLNHKTALITGAGKGLGKAIALALATEGVNPASKFGLIGMSESLMQEARKSNIRVFTLTPSTIATDLAIDNKLTDGNPDTTLQPQDFAELLVAHLKLPARALVKDVSLWSTNP